MCIIDIRLLIFFPCNQSRNNLLQNLDFLWNWSALRSLRFRLICEQCNALPWPSCAHQWWAIMHNIHAYRATTNRGYLVPDDVHEVISGFLVVLDWKGKVCAFRYIADKSCVINVSGTWRLYIFWYYCNRKVVPPGLWPLSDMLSLISTLNCSTTVTGIGENRLLAGHSCFLHGLWPWGISSHLILKMKFRMSTFLVKFVP